MSPSALFFSSVQQDLKLFLFFPLLSAVFRAIFILAKKPKSYAGQGRTLWHCFRFGFWWGMDIHAYVFPLSLVLVTLPGLFLPLFAVYGDALRTLLGLVYALVLYLAFAGKMIFYTQFHDIFNPIVFLGRKAEKHNLLDIFLHQYHGLWILVGIIPYLLVTGLLLASFLATPMIPYPAIDGAAVYVADTVLVLLLVALFYFCRYGGTFYHDDKPEWDTIPADVKAEPFLAKATVDDLIALKNLLRHPLDVTMQKSEAEHLQTLQLCVEKNGHEWHGFDALLASFRREAEGARISLPSHVFLIVGESYSQPYFDPVFDDLHIADEGKKFRADPHTASIETTIPAGMISRPSIVALMSGIFDAGLELNEREPFWQGTVPMALPVQMRRLGFSTAYWYGGSAANGNFTHFAPAMGFEHVYSGTEICPPDAPRNWVGVFDHVFLSRAAEMIEQAQTDAPEFHFLYTTSNHGPYKLPLRSLGFDAERIMHVGRDVLDEEIIPKVLGAYWYCDQAIMAFVRRMHAAFPDSLFIVTGDHGAECSQLQHTSFMKREYTYRELYCPVLMFHHRNLAKDALAGNRIGSHMAIAPTLMELLAPKGFPYYALECPLTSPVTHCITPDMWLTQDAIGRAGEAYYQRLSAASGAETEQGDPPFIEESEAAKSLTAYLLQHPTFLRDAASLL